MIKEFKYQIRQKYVLVLIAIFVFCLVAAISMANDADVTVDKDFSYDIEKYESIDEIRELYEKLQQEPVEDSSSEIKTQSMSEHRKNYYLQLYQYIIDNNLPYDSLVEFNDASYGGLRKHTQFHAFGFSSYMIMMFMLLSCGLIGSIVPTIDFTRKTAKLVYTSGVSKKKILLNKYAVSLVSLLCLELIIEIITMLIALAFNRNGATYCYILWGNKLGFLNYFQFVIIHILHNSIMCIVIYTIIFFFSFLCKNTIISTVSVFSIMLANAMLTIRFKEYWAERLFYMPNEGLLSCLSQNEYMSEPTYLLLIFVYVAIACVLCVGALEATKKFDFSR